MPNHMTNILEAPARVVAAFVVPMNDEQRADAITDAKNKLMLQQQRKRELDARPASERNPYADYLAEHIDEWIAEAEANVAKIEKDPPKFDLSFAGVVPQPEGLETEACGHILNDVKPGEPEEDGVVCWYKWNSAFWGTKWDMYTVELMAVGGTTLITPDTMVRLSFETAWTTPIPVFEALAKRFPNETFRVLFAEENTGNYFGWMIASNGELDVTDGDMMGNANDVDVAFASAIQGQDVAETLTERRSWHEEADEETTIPDDPEKLERLAEAVVAKLAELTGVDLSISTDEMSANTLASLIDDAHILEKATPKQIGAGEESASND